MARATASVFTFRLSCGCLAVLPGVQVSKDGIVTSKRKSEVLCARCRTGALIVRRYPPPYASCAMQSWAADAGGTLRRVRCCLASAHEGDHDDTIIGITFPGPGRLSGGAAGNTRRA